MSKIKHISRRHCQWPAASKDYVHMCG